MWDCIKIVLNHILSLQGAIETLFIPKKMPAKPIGNLTKIFLFVQHAMMHGVDFISIAVSWCRMHINIIQFNDSNVDDNSFIHRHLSAFRLFDGNIKKYFFPCAYNYFCYRCSRATLYVKNRKKCQQRVKLKRRHEWIGKSCNSFPHTSACISIIDDMKNVLSTFYILTWL